MKTIASTLTLLTLAASLVACGDDTSGSGGGGGSGGATSATTATGTTSATTTTGTTGSTTSATTTTTNATTTTTGGGGEGGGTGGGGGAGGGEVGPAALDCSAPDPEAAHTCGGISGELWRCDVFTNEGCDTDAGEVCHLSIETDENGNDLGFGTDCFPLAPTQTLCDTCNDSDSFCGPGTFCSGYFFSPEDFEYGCARYCCEDADCDAGSSCIPFNFDGTDVLGGCFVN